MWPYRSNREDLVKTVVLAVLDDARTHVYMVTGQMASIFPFRGDDARLLNPASPLHKRGLFEAWWPRDTVILGPSIQCPEWKVTGM